MKKTGLILVIISLLALIPCFARVSLAEDRPKWQKVITAKVLSVDTKNKQLIVEFQEKEFLKTKDVKLTIKVWTRYKPTEILIGNQRGSLEGIKEGDIVRVTYEPTASAGNVAIGIEVLSP